jgi:hypothetical protein
MNLDKMILVEWGESEFGSSAKPKEYTLHLTKRDSDNYIMDYLTGESKEVLSEHSRPHDLSKVIVTPKLYSIISESKNGIRFLNEIFDKYIQSGDLIK